MPNSRTPGIPRSAASFASFTSSSTDVCATPGMDVSGLRKPDPGATNSGRMRLETSTRVSRTSARKTSVFLRRRGRYSGKDDIIRHSQIHIFSYSHILCQRQIQPHHQRVLGRREIVIFPFANFIEAERL